MKFSFPEAKSSAVCNGHVGESAGGSSPAKEEPPFDDDEPDFPASAVNDKVDGGDDVPTEAPLGGRERELSEGSFPV